MSRVSVIIPAYQHAAELPPCLDSLLRQTFSNFEVIVVDDGSTDDTAERVKPYLDRVKYIRQENRGAPAARNRGAVEARGEFLLFLDADAVLRRDALELLVDALDRDPGAAYAYSSFAFGWKRFQLWPFDGEVLKRQNYIHTSALIRRERFPGFDESVRRFQDWDLWLTMFENGDRGVFVNELLMRFRPRRDGISNWVPGLIYRLPWRRFGFRSRNLEKYEAARAVVAAKHRLPPPASLPTPPVPPTRVFLGAVLWFLLLEVVSFLGFYVPDVNVVGFVLATLIVFVLAWRRPDLALLVAVGELVAGSQGGYLLSLPLSGFTLSWRIAVFLCLFTAFASRSALGFINRRPEVCAWWREMRSARVLWPYLALLAACAAAGVIGLLRGNGFGDVFFDANGYLYLLLLPVLWSAWRKDTWPRVFAVIAAGLAVAVLKSLFVVYVYSHRLFAFAVSLYTWIRDSRVGEITLMGGDFYRVFFQSQVFALAAGLVALVTVLYARDWRWRKGALGVLWLTSVSMALSLSRSFWFGAFAAALTTVVGLLVVRAKPKVWARFAVPVAGVGVVAVLSILVVFAFPWPGKGGTGFADAFGSRMAVNDAAAQSRWDLLPELTKAALRHPIEGSGFGTSVTYRTSDPRQVSLTGGAYTTYAFEWGWHDLWLKLGLLGLAVYGWWLVALMRPYLALVARERRRFREPEPGLALEQKKAAVAASVILVVIALLFTNVFSPYLNHPLGIGLLAVIAIAGAKEMKA